MRDIRIIVSTLAVYAALCAQSTPASSTLTVSGDVTTKLVLSASDLAKMPRANVSFKEHDGTAYDYEGVPIVDLLKKAGIPTGSGMRGKTLAGYVIAKAHDGYQVVFSLGELDPDVSGSHIIIADKRNDKPIEGEQGPLRIVCGGDKVGARSVRMVEELEVVRLKK